jgi:pyruvate/2-oxoglutarate dehydrogenase complex dihydrolipoamide dehydrogenase (E3) component
VSVAFDLAVIGGGTAGLVAAQTATAQRKRVLLISEGPLGGECTWNGCVPSKALIEAAAVYHSAATAGRFGVRVGELSVDFPGVMDRVHAVIENIARYEDAAHLEADGVVVRRGRARFIDARTLQVEDERFTAEHVVVCTGSRPDIPAMDGLDGVPYLTNETIFALREQPHHLLVLGAGAVGLELAHAFARLGTEVDVFDAASVFLPREDPDIATVARAILESEGVRLHLGALRARVEAAAGGITLTVRDASGERPVPGDQLLVATGRRPNVDGLGLDTIGVRVERSGIVVDAHLRTSVGGVFAAGDVTGTLPFTHIAAYQGRLAAANAVGRARAASYRVIPWVIFTDPEIAHVGLTEPEARHKHGDAVRAVLLPFTAVDRAVIAGRTRGLIKVITATRPILGGAGGGRLVGAHIIGPGAGELIHEFVIGMQVNAFSGRLAQAVHAYPAMSVGVQQAVALLFEHGRATAGALREDLLAGDGEPASAPSPESVSWAPTPPRRELP